MIETLLDIRVIFSPNSTNATRCRRDAPEHHVNSGSSAPLTSERRPQWIANAWSQDVDVQMFCQNHILITRLIAITIIALYVTMLLHWGLTLCGPSMRISAEMFEAITTSIRGDSRDEKRKEPRVGLSGKVFIVVPSPSTDRKPKLVAVRDLSAGGIGIIHNEKLEPGQQFNLLLKYEQIGLLKEIICTVRWSRSLGSGLYAIGAKFTARQGKSAQIQESATPGRAADAEPARPGS
jgi:PilZ domain